MRVAAVSLNRGEVRRALTATALPEGWRPGWDVAGVVEQPAEDGPGPKKGARVVGFLRSGGWASSPLPWVLPVSRAWPLLLA